MPVFTPGKPGCHSVRVQVGQAEALLPVVQGFVRCTEARGPVDRGGAADTATLHDSNAAIRRGPTHAFLIEVGIGVQLVHPEILLGVELAFLNHDDRETGTGQDFSGSAAAGTGTDNDDIGFQCLAFG